MESAGEPRELALTALDAVVAERREVLAALDHVDAWLLDAIRAARRAGVRWDEIAERVGFSRQAIAKRFGTDSAP